LSTIPLIPLCHPVPLTDETQKQTQPLCAESGTEETERTARQPVSAVKIPLLFDAVKSLPG
jgi:hypothetical protein